MTTVRDIAREAGVSPMTVSNVINGRYERVSAATARRVKEVMERRGYVPSAPARALSSKNSNVIALVYPGEVSGHQPLANPHDSAFIGEIERQVGRSGRYLMIHAAENVIKTAANLRTWHVDGAIFLGTIASEVDDLRRRYEVPMVFVDNYSSSPEVRTVGIDDFRGGYLAGQHLVEAGHERLAFVGPQIEGEGVLHQRFLGFSRAVADAGMESRSIAVLRCDSHFRDGLELAGRLAADPRRPTGIFATADIIAIGLLKGFLVSGVRVPEEVSLIGFDGLPETTYVLPAVSTIRQDVAAKARAAVQALLALLEGEPEEPAERITLGVELVAGGTVGPPRGQRPAGKASHLG
jgi:LacI family transcriptional regulator